MINTRFGFSISTCGIRTTSHSTHSCNSIEENTSFKNKQKPVHTNPTRIPHNLSTGIPKYMKLSFKRFLEIIVLLLGICSAFPNPNHMEMEEEPTLPPKDFLNENISIIVEICDMVAYLILLGIYEYKTRTYPWTVYRVLFRVLTGIKLFDDILHIIPYVMTIRNGYQSGYVVSNFSLIVSSIIRGLLLFANTRYSSRLIYYV